MKLKYIFLALIVGLVIGLFDNAYSAEKDYQIPWCKEQGGLWEVPAITIRDPFTGKVEGFVDCLTAKHAIEVDFDYKWKEAPAQAMWYAGHTGKRAGILLIITYNKNGMQNSGYKKLMELIYNNNLPIDVWTIDK